MQVLNVLLIGALFGVAYCELDCYQQKLRDCTVKVFIGKREWGFCDVQPDVLHCFKIAASECGKPFVSAVEKVELTIRDMCTEGTPLNKEMKENKDCVVNVLEKQTCAQNMDDKEKICKNMDEIARCLLYSTRKSCGNDAYRFAEKIILPVVEMQKGHCEDFFVQNSLSHTGPFGFLFNH